MTLLPYRRSSLWATVPSPFLQKINAVLLPPFQPLGYCTPYKTIVIPCEYESARAFVGDAAIVMRNRKYGAINRKGRLFIPCRYTSLAEAVREIYEDDDEVPLTPDDLDDDLYCTPLMVEGEISTYAGVEFRFSGGKYRALDETVSTESYDALDDFWDGLIWVQKNEKWGAIDPSGEEIIPCMYEDMEPFDEDHREYTLVLLNGQWGIIDQHNVQYWED